MTAKTIKSRCKWAENDPLMREYHDLEWGVPVRDSRELWELLMLEGFQAGLAWIIVLRKRDAFRKAFKGFDPAKVARFGEADVERLLQDPGIIRSRAKIEATIQAAHLPRYAKGRGRLLFVSLGHCGRQAYTDGRICSGANAARGGDVEAVKETRLQVCWPRDRLCLYAGLGNDERS